VRFYRLRRALAAALITLFVVLPHVSLAGKPALFFDLGERRFTVLGVTLHPTDNLLLLAFGATIVIGIFVTTTLFGRLWCGYACPQPIYLEFVFRPLARLLAGKSSARRGATPRTLGMRLVALTRRAATGLALTLVALGLAASFVLYFVRPADLAAGIRAAPAALSGAVAALLATAGLVLLDFTYLCERMCTVACPYGRLQSLLYDEDTIVVGYDGKRGDPRGKHTKTMRPRGLGDCIDCGRCVTVCPTGIDIREGLQMECIGCALCIDNCDRVMHALGKPPGLIRYTSERELDTGTRRVLRPRILGYGALLGLALATLATLGVTRPPASAQLVRNASETYRLLRGGDVANLLRMRLTNQRATPQRFIVSLVAPPNAHLVVGETPLAVAPNDVRWLDLVASLPASAFVDGQSTAKLLVTSDQGAHLDLEFVLLGPYGAAAPASPPSTDAALSTPRSGGSP